MFANNSFTASNNLSEVSPKFPVVISSQLNCSAYRASNPLAASEDFSEAIETACEAIRLVAPADPSSLRIAMAFEPLALGYVMQGDSPRAARLEGYADAAFRRLGFEREYTETTTYDRLRAQLAVSLAPDHLTRLLAEGVALSPEAAIALALESAEA